MAKKRTAEIKLGIIGTGQIGKAHIRRYQEVPDCQIVAVADINEAEANRVAAEFDIPHVFTEFREMLKVEAIDAVDVCLHNNLHAPVTIAALEAGKHVYCEKPMAGAYPDARAMYDTAQETGRKLSIQLGTLFQMETKAARRLIDEGHVGDIYYAKSYGHRRRGRPWVDGYGSNAFVQKKTAQGGALYDMGVYHIANILYLIGNPEVQTVSGTTHAELDMYEDRRKAGPWEVEELGIGFVRLAGGITFVIEEAWALHSDGGESPLVAGSKGGVKLAPFGYFTTLADMPMDGTFDLGGTDRRWHSCFPETACYDSPQHHWIAALLGRCELIDTAGIALNTMKVSEGIYLSERLGREVTAAEIETKSKSTAVQGL
ncbi:MAG: Gfo/Idh/MocA family protein [Planctomycetota bacterium]